MPIMFGIKLNAAYNNLVDFFDNRNFPYLVAKILNGWQANQ